VSQPGDPVVGHRWAYLRGGRRAQTARALVRVEAEPVGGGHARCLRRVLIAAEFRPQHLDQPTCEESPRYVWPGHKQPHNAKLKNPFRDRKILKGEQHSRRRDRVTSGPARPEVLGAAVILAVPPISMIVVRKGVMSMGSSAAEQVLGRQQRGLR
jgi:hypothetical protein